MSSVKVPTNSRFLMGLLVLVIAIAAVNTLSPAKRAEIRRNIRQCSKKADVIFRNALLVLKGNFDDNRKEMKYFIRCMFEKIDYLGEDGEFDEELLREKLRENIDEAEVTELFQKCTMTGDDLDDTCWRRFKCFFENHDVPSDLLDF